MEDIAAHEDIRLGGLPRHGIRLGGAVAVQDDFAALEQIAPLGALADGHEHVGTGHGDGLVFVVDRRKFSVLVVHADALFEDDTGDPAVLGEDLLRAPAVADLDILGEDLFHLVPGGGHLVPLLQTEHGDLAVGAAQRRAGHVGGHVAAAHDRHVAFQLRGLTKVHVPQEGDSRPDALRVLAGHAREAAALQADGDEKALVALRAQFVQRDVPADLHAAADLSAHGFDDLYFFFKH